MNNLSPFKLTLAGWLLRRGIIRALVCLVSLGSLLGLPAVNHGTGGAAEASPMARQLMDYHDVSELRQVLQDLADGSRHAQLFTIGYGMDYESDSFPRSYRIYALRVSASTDETIEDDYRKNSILFECGTHAREWLTTESCLMLAEHLVDNAENRNTSVPELLANVDVWIIPLTNPAGRILDDRDGGDPRQFSTEPNRGGWRGNGDTRECEYGVDIARNFSTDWNSASSDCGSKYRGFAPFSTMEATALREFVQNHGISMAVVVHSNAEKIWNLWGTGDVAGASIVQLAEFGWRIYELDNPGLALEIKKFGTGVGQFSAWLSGPSDTPGQPDVGTVRGIQTIFVELPFLSEDADDVTPPEVPERNYNGDYRYRDNDTSNGFHPSGEHTRDLVRRNFILMAEELIYESRSPGCPLLGQCPDRDFGLVGAKIGTNQLRAGKLISYPALRDGTRIVPARDYLGPGYYYLDYRVQNFSRERGYDDLDVQMTVIRTISRPDGSESSLSRFIQLLRDLPKRAVATGRFSLNVERNAMYTVSLEARPAGGFMSNETDDFSKNDKKVFKFQTSL
jgi:hypothetical protein